MLVIDAHVHLWHQDRARYPAKAWVVDLFPHDGTADRLVALMDEAGVAAALNVQNPWYADDNRYHHESIRRFPDRFALLAVLDPSQRDAPQRLERMAKTESAQGMRIHFNEPGRRESMLAGEFDRLVATAGRLGVPIQFLAGMADMAAVARAAAAFPGTKFIADHLGHPDLSEEPPYPSASGFFALGRHPNVYAKVSKLCDISRREYPYPDVQDYVRRTIESFGARRLMWGSNFPLIPEVRTEQPVDYRRSLDLVRHDWPWLADSDKEWILGKTALSLWDFPVNSGEALQEGEARPEPDLIGTVEALKPNEGSLDIIREGIREPATAKYRLIFCSYSAFKGGAQKPNRIAGSDALEHHLIELGFTPANAAQWVRKLNTQPSVRIDNVTLPERYFYTYGQQGGHS